MSPGEDGLIGIPFPEHSNELLSHLNDQRRTGLFCDLTLTSRGARYPTHRSVMAAVSLYFRRLFGAEEAGGEAGGGFSVCQLDCVAPDALDALLEFAYTATLTIPSSGMRDVLRGAQLLGIQCVADACRDILGETVEAEQELVQEQEVQLKGSETRMKAELGTGKASRRKTDKRRVRKIGLNHIYSSPLRPLAVSPVSHSSPGSDGFRSMTSTQPPSPEQENPHCEPGQNGDQKELRDRKSVPNGGLQHWPQERLHRAHSLPLQPPNDKLFEEEDKGHLADDGAQVGSEFIPAAEQGEASLVTGLGRKRKSQTPQQCPVCQKIIHGAGKLPRHMRTHTGEKPFQCTTCGVRFTRNDKLKIHMRKHTGERPYSCPHCPARFLHSYDLKNHLSLHSGARPFECSLCHKAFAREDHLQRHRKGQSCLELRTRRPRRGPEQNDEEGDQEGRGERASPLSLPAHSSLYYHHAAALEGLGGLGSKPSLMFTSERERSMALQALDQLGHQSRSRYPELFLRELEMHKSRDKEEDHSVRTHMLSLQNNRWADEEMEEEEPEGE